MDPFKTAIRAALRCEPVNLDDFEGEERELLAKASALARSVEVLTDEILDAKAQSIIITALAERVAMHDPACRGASC